MYHIFAEDEKWIYLVNSSKNNQYKHSICIILKTELTGCEVLDFGFDGTTKVSCMRCYILVNWFMPMQPTAIDFLNWDVFCPYAADSLRLHNNRFSLACIDSPLTWKWSIFQINISIITNDFLHDNNK